MVQFIVLPEPLWSFAAKAASILLGLLAIPVLFYSLGGMPGKTPDWVNIAIFFSDALFLMSFRLLTRGAARRRVAARRLSPCCGRWPRVRVLHLPPHPPPALA